MPRNNFVMLALGALIVVVGVLAYQLYQERHKSGINVEIGGKQLLHIEEK